MATRPNFSQYTSADNTLAGLIARLSYYIGLLRGEAQYLALTEAAEEALASGNLAKITEAILNIKVVTPKTTGTVTNDNVLKPGASVEIPVGYYKEKSVYSVAAIDDITTVDGEKVPEADEIITGKEAWVNGEVVSGTLVDNSGQTVTITGSDTSDAGKLTVSIPKAKYDENSIINTNIDVQTTYAYDAQVTVVKTPEGESAVKKTFNIPAGYYALDVVVTPVFDAEGKTYESEINVKDLTVSASGTFTPGNDYDYIERVEVAKAAISESTLTIDAANAQVAIPVTTKGWTDEDSYTVSLAANNMIAKDTQAKETVDEDVNLIEITPGDAQSVTVNSGLYKENTVIKVKPMSDGESLTEDNISVKSIAVNEEDSSKFTVTVKVDKSGYISAEDYVASDIAASTLTVSNLGEGTSASEIQAKSIQVDATEGYTTVSSNIYTIREAELNTVTPTIVKTSGAITIPVTTSGWIDKDVLIQLPITLNSEAYTPNNVGDRISAGTYLTGDLVINAVNAADGSLDYDGIKNEVEGKKTIVPGNKATYMEKAEVDLSALVNAMAAL